MAGPKDQQSQQDPKAPDPQRAPADRVDPAEQQPVFDASSGRRINPPGGAAQTASVAGAAPERANEAGAGVDTTGRAGGESPPPVGAA